MAEQTVSLMAQQARCEHFMLPQNGWVPNNRRLPVLLWRAAVEPHARDAAARFEALFEQNGWPPQWRDSVFDYHHFHSTAHEALGIASGDAELIVGGPHGRVIAVSAGDALILPAGTGHCLLRAGRRFQVIGAYPPGQQWDIRREALSDEERTAMEELPFPRCDPVAGEDGPLARHWH